MKSRDGKSQRREEKKKEDQKRESLRRKKIQVREKVGKSRFTMFFQWIVAPAGRKVGSLKGRVWSPLGRWEMKNCTPLWREAHFEAKMYKAPQLRTTFGSWDVEKVHAVVACSRTVRVSCTSISVGWCSHGTSYHIPHCTLQLIQPSTFFAGKTRVVGELNKFKII